MGHTFGLGDNRLGGMFESYLADSPNTSEDALEYRATIDSILKAVSPYTKNVSVSQKIRDGFSFYREQPPTQEMAASATPYQTPSMQRCYLKALSKTQNNTLPI